MPKGLVVTALGNQIEYVTHNGKGLITGKRVNVTDDAIKVVFEHMMREFNNAKSKDATKEFFGYSYKGCGTLKYLPPKDI